MASGLQPNGVLAIDTPAWAEPLLAPAELKGAKGGRSSGKSHAFAEMLVDRMVADPDLRWVCLREIQKTLRFSAKSLLESKLVKLGVSHLFDMQRDLIKRKDGGGVVIFQGMQDHNADSIKSLEGFDGAWFEEAQTASARSLELLIPTIRKDGSEIWFSWNPDQPTDAVEQLEWGGPDAVLVTVNYYDNPWLPNKSLKAARAAAKKDYEKYLHIWEGRHNVKSEAQIFGGYWRVDEFEPAPDWDGPYHGLDFGFSTDPTALVRCWISGNTLHIDRAETALKLDIDRTPAFLRKHAPGIEGYELPADCARPESISYLARHGIPRCVAAPKWSGSVEDGIEFIKGFDEIVIHAGCPAMIDEARLYSYKVDRKSGQVLPDIIDADNHCWDAVRYALNKLIKRNRKTAGVW